jgi:hypothetical protein
MFFIARCIFWLSLVYAHLPAQDGASRGAAFMDMAARHADAFTRQAAASAAAQAGAAATDLCRRNAGACAHVALEAAGLGGKAPVDTLTAADRQPRWQGRKGS